MGKQSGTTTEDKERIAELQKEVRELRRANSILKSAPALFVAELDCPSRVAYIDANKEEFGVEPICKVPGRPWNNSSCPQSLGSIGGTSVGCTRPLAASHQPSSKRLTYRRLGEATSAA